MDNQHRHDLEENDLQEFIMNFREWWSKWGNATMTIVAVVCLAVAVYLILSTRATQAHESAWNDLANSAGAQALAQVASEHSDTTVKVLANLRAADIYLSNAAVPQVAKSAKPKDQSGETSAKEKSTQTSQAPAPKLSQAEQLTRAKAMYKSVLEIAKHPLFKLNALMGLASVAENKGNWAQAGDYYQQAKTLGKKSGYTNFTSNANARLDHIKELKHPVNFAPKIKEPQAKPVTEKPKTSVKNGDDSSKAKTKATEKSGKPDEKSSSQPATQSSDNLQQKSQVKTSGQTSKQP